MLLDWWILVLFNGVGRLVVQVSAGVCRCVSEYRVVCLSTEFSYPIPDLYQWSF